MKKRAVFYVLSAILLAAILYSADQLLVKGILSWHIRQPEYWTMMAEAGLLLVFFFVVFKFGKSLGFALFAAGVGIMVFTWCHVVFLPMAVSGFYLVYLILAGRILRVKVFRYEAEESVAADFIMGSGFVLTLFSLMSALGYGRIEYLQTAVLIHGIILAIPLIRQIPLHRERLSRPMKLNLVQAVCFSFLITMVMIQIGRLNLAIDFDSLWYGLRSRYILDNGRGIYENMGTIGVVYTYSKGFEVLTLPLANLPSYSFLTGFNVWSAVLVLWSAYRIGLRYMSRGFALAAAALMSVVPGIMNMSMTAKSDMVTLLLQMLMILFLLCYIERGRTGYLLTALSAFLLSWTMKPTAMVFSTAVLGMSGIYLIAAGKLKWNASLRQVLGLLPALFALTGIWARTLLMAGVPVTSVFSSVFVKMGFDLKYPFGMAQIPNEGLNLSVMELFYHLLKRLYGVLLSPTGEEMSHVVLAWGGIAVLFFTILAMAGRILPQKASSLHEKELILYAKVAGFPFSAVCILSLMMLSQVDGNYFMLLYVMIVLMGCGILSSIEGKALKQSMAGLLIPLALYQMVILSLTSWSWTAQFSDISLIHRGYYNHQAAAYKRMSENGNKNIWDILSKDPRTRLIAVGEHPKVLEFPCSAQSYDDITGVWGNVALVKSMDNFIQFLNYAKTDYIYMQAGYMEENTRCYELMRYLIENGTLTNIIYENGSALAQVHTDAIPSEASVLGLSTFDMNYRRKE